LATTIIADVLAKKAERGVKNRMTRDRAYEQRAFVGKHASARYPVIRMHVLVTNFPMDNTQLVSIIPSCIAL
jgi:hypothetical protein